MSGFPLRLGYLLHIRQFKRMLDVSTSLYVVVKVCWCLSCLSLCNVYHNATVLGWIISQFLHHWHNSQHINHCSGILSILEQFASIFRPMCNAAICVRCCLRSSGYNEGHIPAPVLGSSKAWSRPDKIVTTCERSSRCHLLDQSHEVFDPIG